MPGEVCSPPHAAITSNNTGDRPPVPASLLAIGAACQRQHRTEELAAVAAVVSLFV